jgi:dimethylhistidine N-methyltransferase
MSRTLRFYDYAPDAGNILQEVLDGLRARPKTLPPKLFYDERGSELFAMICRLPEYYLTRTEAAIMRAHAAAMAGMIGPRAMLIEYGSGTADKTRILLDHLDAPVAYIPVDISCQHLTESSAEIAADYPGLRVMPVCADYDQPFDLPAPREPADRRIVYFPGSTIGNFHPGDAVAFMARMARRAGPRGAVLIGVDLKKDRALLHAAYNDAAGVTAAFNLNMLTRLNREVGADFDVERFEHHALYNQRAGRIEMHLVSEVAQTVTLGGHAVAFSRGETVWTESSYKYSLAGFARLAARAGLGVGQVWTDDRNLFSVHFLTVRSTPNPTHATI